MPPICQEIDFEIKGDDLQFVEIGLDPGETVVAEAGGMMFIEEGINYSIER
ncbi:MAG: AIM24 family protein, partial [Acidimicrobiales bacterium]|nr:AIM24 family protein [Acidimicrobiales bacterium]